MQCITKMQKTFMDRIIVKIKKNYRLKTTKVENMDSVFIQFWCLSESFVSFLFGNWCVCAFFGWTKFRATIKILSRPFYQKYWFQRPRLIRCDSITLVVVNYCRRLSNFFPLYIYFVPSNCFCRLLRELFLCII